MLHQKKLGLKRLFGEGNAEPMSPAWAPQLNVLITKPDKRSINSHYSVSTEDASLAPRSVDVLTLKIACCDMKKDNFYMD